MTPPPFKLVAVAPTFNNAATLPAILAGLAALRVDVIVVNDGSTDATAGILADLEDRHEAPATVVTHARNRGKAAALRTGFALARERGYSHALTIDTDGQHLLEDVPAMVKAARDRPEAFVLGARSEKTPGYPAANRLGRWLCNLAIYMETGVRVIDSQCGLRVYPLAMTDMLRCWSGRYGYEAEVLTRAAWAGAPFVQVPVGCTYRPPGGRVSHFRPVVDTARIWLMHFVLSVLRIVPTPAGPQWPPASWREPPADESGQPADSSGQDHPTHAASWLASLAKWASPMELWRQLRRDRVSQLNASAGVGVGVVIANLPIYPFQTLAAIYVARRFHLHPIAVVLGAQVSMPPICFVLIAGAIGLGHLLLFQAPPDLAGLYQQTWTWATFEQVMREYWLSWWVGGVIIGVVMGWAAFAITAVVLARLPVPEVDEALVEPVASPPSPSPSSPSMPQDSGDTITPAAPEPCPTRDA